ncbi:MAG TPA: DoxX family membrane protein [Pyrinomonadaceae bacterium]|nr:DoxX family membrane protein [Pyrinomonadaceae bacterium]
MRVIKRILKYFLTIAFVAAGANHFLNAEFYLKIMPPFLPAPLFLIYLSGIFQIALGILLLIPKFTRLAAFGLIALLIAVFPANIYMAANPQLFSEYSPTALYIRLPVQLILIVLVFWVSKSEKLKVKSEGIF